MRNFRLLKPSEIEVRVQTIKENGVSALLYKTARTDYQLLDEEIGMMNWANDYKTIDGKMYCGIGIKDTHTDEWVWKWNCGTESNQDAEKGQASDAMKRAGFAWGIGTELYSSPFIWIPEEKCSIKKIKLSNGNEKLICNDKFKVTNIEYDDDENIKALVISNERTLVTVFSYGASNYTNPLPEARKTAAESKEVANDGTFTPTCKQCGKEITVRVHDFAVKKFGAPYCMECQDKIKANANR